MALINGCWDVSSKNINYMNGIINYKWDVYVSSILSSIYNLKWPNIGFPSEWVYNHGIFVRLNDNSPSDGRGHMESQTRLGLQDMCCAKKKKREEKSMNSEDDFPDLDAINRAVPAVPWWCLWLACWTRLTNAWGIGSAIGVTWLRLRWFQLDCWRVEK